MLTPRELGLPFDDWRPGQRLALRTVLSARTSHIVINAPTGSGKSTIALALPKLDERRHVILTATKGLMDQYVAATPDLVDIRGMANYACLAAKDEFKTYFPLKRRWVGCDDGPCHAGETCTLREDGCQYYDAYRRFLGAHEGVTNYSMWLASRTWGKGLGVSQRLVCDEAHRVPEQLMAARRIEIHKSLISGRTPRHATGWRRWAESQIEALGVTLGDADDQRMLRHRTIQSLQQLAKIDETWAWDDLGHSIVFEPTHPSRLLDSLQTLDKYSSVVYLSATITPSTLHMLGIEDRDITYYEMRSRFPVDRRPIYLLGGARVDYRTMKDPEAVGRWARAIADFCAVRDDRSGVIMSVSFDRAEQIEALVDFGGRDVIVHRRGTPVAQVVHQFKNSRRGTILISPSVGEGFDFPYELCEFIVIAKMPFPDTRSNITKARIKAIPHYRDHLTAQAFMQACGRGMRADDDQCEVAVVDEHAQWFLRDRADLIAPWVREAVIRTGRRVTPLRRL